MLPQVSERSRISRLEVQGHTNARHRPAVLPSLFGPGRRVVPKRMINKKRTVQSRDRSLFVRIAAKKIRSFLLPRSVVDHFLPEKAILESDEKYHEFGQGQFCQVYISVLKSTQ